MTLYRYGALAWLWRPMIVLFLAGGMLMVPEVLGGSIGAAAVVVPLWGPALFFGLVVAVRIDQRSDGTLRVHSLLWWRRTITADRLGEARLRMRYQTRGGAIKAPAVWVPVKGGLPVYVDLWADIPDRARLKQTLRIPAPWT